MNDRKLKYIFGPIALLLFVGLIYKIIKLPGGLILPGYFMGGMLLVATLICSVIVSIVAKLIFKSNSFLTVFAAVVIIASLGLHYYFYSPTLKIIVPKGYTGSVTLVLSNVNKNILTLDSNGIGYINKRTFAKTYTVPDVVDNEGASLNSQCVGFNQSTFWSKGVHTSTRHPERIHTLSFEIVPRDKEKQKLYKNNADFTELVDSTKILTEK